MAYTQEELNNIVNSLIIDNNINQITPAKLRQVLFAINKAINVTDPATVTAISPLFLNPFENEFSIQPVTPTQNGYLEYLDYNEFKSFKKLPKMQFTADGIATSYDIGLPIPIVAVFWNGAALNDNDFSQLGSIFTLTFTPASGDIIKPI